MFGCAIKGGQLASKQNSHTVKILQYVGNSTTNCSSLTFELAYSRILAQQDDNIEYHLLGRPVQLNCIVDTCAKRVVWKHGGNKLSPHNAFPLEVVAVFVGQEK